MAVSTATILVLPGDGIGPEVVRPALTILQSVADAAGMVIRCEEAPIGAAALASDGEPVSQRTLEAARRADAVLLGAVGHPSADHELPARRPEAGLLALRRALGVYANLRPVQALPGVDQLSPLRPERVAGADLLVVRELLGGLYFGEPRVEGPDEAWNTMRYQRYEVERIAHVAFRAARDRRGRVLSVDKANVLEVSRLWRRVVTNVAAEYPDVALEHGYVDSVAMRLVLAPASIDVLLTENLFGDILSDAAAVLPGSLGVLPSASLGDGPGLFEPVHGSAPDLAGTGRANPVGAILSVALLLRHGLGRDDLARRIEEAVAVTLAEGCRTPDLGGTADTQAVAARVLEVALAAEVSRG